MTPPAGLAATARVSQVSLRNMRTWRRLDASFDAQLNVIVGPNGVGKTNLLEALAIACLGASPRTSAELRVITESEPFARIAVSVEVAERTHERTVVYDRAQGKRLTLDGQVVRSGRTFAETIGCAVFLPERMLVIRGAAARRRAVVDRLLEQTSPTAADELRRYTKAVQQRNVLLRRAKSGADVRTSIEPWTNQVVELGMLVRQQRDRLLEQLQEPFAERLAQLTGFRGGRLVMQQRGEHLARAMTEGWAADVRRGSTTAGPHLDDIVPTHEQRDLRTWGSTGEQRAALLAWTLADADVLQQLRGQVPIVLLDEPWAELDVDRRRRLTDVLDAHGGQVFITATEPPQHVHERMRPADHSLDIRHVSSNELTPWIPPTT